ncbi:MAG: hypothetical protein Q7T55_04740, partial [Solirubrobacteraceae bacterium]|nr:hypothetical protein [Solirubrobacteraceae bacterium]
TPTPTPVPGSGLPGAGPTPVPDVPTPTATPVVAGPNGSGSNGPGSNGPGSGATAPAGTGGSSSGGAGSGGSTSAPSAGAGNALLSETSSPEAIAAAFGLPSAKACLSKRAFVIRLKVPSGVKVKSAKITVNGKTSKARLTKGRWQATVDLRGLRKARVTVGITVMTSASKTLKGTRSYGVCGAKRGS